MITRNNMADTDKTVGAHWYLRSKNYGCHAQSTEHWSCFVCTSFRMSQTRKTLNETIPTGATGCASDAATTALGNLGDPADKNFPSKREISSALRNWAMTVTKQTQRNACSICKYKLASKACIQKNTNQQHWRTSWQLNAKTYQTGVFRSAIGRTFVVHDWDDWLQAWEHTLTQNDMVSVLSQ